MFARTGATDSARKKKEAPANPVMKVVMLENEIDCVTAATLENIRVDVAEGPVEMSVASLANPSDEMRDDEQLQKKMAEWQCDAVLWFTCGDGGMHMAAQLDGLLRQTRIIPREDSLLSHEAIVAVAAGWFDALVPGWQQLQQQRKENALARQVVADEKIPTAQQSIPESSLKEPTPVSQTRFELALSGFGVRVAKSDVVPGGAIAFGIQLKKHLLLFSRIGVMKPSRYSGGNTKIVLRRYLLGIGAGWQWVFRRVAFRIGLELESVPIAYVTHEDNAVADRGLSYQLSIAPLLCVSVKLSQQWYVSAGAGIRMLLVKPVFDILESGYFQIIHAPSSLQPAAKVGLGFIF